MKGPLLSLLGVLFGVIIANSVVSVGGLAPTIIPLPTAVTLGLAPGEDATFPADPDPLIRWTASDSPRTLGSGPVHLGLLGDSEVYGYCVGRSHAPDALLQALAPGRFTTVSYGVSGYDAEQIATTALRRVPLTSPRPDVLVWWWNANDGERGTYNELMFARDPDTLYATSEHWLLFHVPLFRLAWSLWARPYTTRRVPAAGDLVRSVAALGIPIILIPMPYGPHPGHGALSDPRPGAAGVPGVRVLELGDWVHDPKAWCDAAHMTVWGKTQTLRQVLEVLP